MVTNVCDAAAILRWIESMLKSRVISANIGDLIEKVLAMKRSPKE